jgi:hypothetical protein
MAPIPKTSQASSPILKNASAAPFIYFDNVPTFGVYSDNIEIEIASRSLMPKPDGKVIAELNCVAHLRCSPKAAMMLMDALEKAITMHAKAQADQANGADDRDETAPLHS